ncbi:hypothetical protein JB92DRAFT_2838995 [Gautieria morchelliformis]|nr:hypothetical protein JB92DRAFT_2838995 [Gautieria morchelliformis]
MATQGLASRRHQSSNSGNDGRQAKSALKLEWLNTTPAQHPGAVCSTSHGPETSHHGTELPKKPRYSSGGAPEAELTRNWMRVKLTSWRGIVWLRGRGVVYSDVHSSAQAVGQVSLYIHAMQGTIARDAGIDYITTSATRRYCRRGQPRLSGGMTGQDGDCDQDNDRIEGSKGMGSRRYKRSNENETRFCSAADWLYHYEYAVSRIASNTTAGIL